MGRPFPLKIALAHGVSGSLGPTQVHNPNSISIGSAILAELTVVWPRYSICNNRLHLRNTTMRPNNDIRHDKFTPAADQPIKKYTVRYSTKN